MVQVFNFKITHVAQSTLKNINEINYQIKQKQTKKNLIEWAKDDIFIPEGIKSVQCSDISNFPKNFE